MGGLWQCTTTHRDGKVMHCLLLLCDVNGLVGWPYATTLQMILDGSKEIQAEYMVLLVGYSINFFKRACQQNVGCIVLASNLVLALFEYSGILAGKNHPSPLLAWIEEYVQFVLFSPQK